MGNPEHLLDIPGPDQIPLPDPPEAPDRRTPCLFYFLRRTRNIHGPAQAQHFALVH